MIRDSKLLLNHGKEFEFFEKLSLQTSLGFCSRVGETVKPTKQDFTVFQSFGERMNIYGTAPQCVVFRTNSDVKVCKFFLLNCVVSNCM